MAWPPCRLMDSEFHLPLRRSLSTSDRLTVVKPALVLLRLMASVWTIDTTLILFLWVLWLLSINPRDTSKHSRTHESRHRLTPCWASYIHVMYSFTLSNSIFIPCSVLIVTQDKVWRSFGLLKAKVPQRIHLHHECRSCYNIFYQWFYLRLFSWSFKNLVSWLLFFFLKMWSSKEEEGFIYKEELVSPSQNYSPLKW